MRTPSLIALTSLLLVAVPASAQLADSALANAPVNAATIAFGTGTTELTVASVRVLDRTIDQLLREPLATAVIVAPLNGSEDDAMFCLRRADVAKAYLTRRGIAEYRVSVAGGGVMAAHGDTAETARRATQIQLTIAQDDVRAQSSSGQARPVVAVVRIGE